MSAPKWELRALDDLSGCWLYWESPAGGMAVEKREGGMKTGYSLTWENCDSDVVKGPFRSIGDAQEAALNLCRKHGKQQLANGAKCLAVGV